MSKKNQKGGLVVTNEKSFVSVRHQGDDFLVAFDALLNNSVRMRMTIPYFRVIVSLVLYAVNHLEAETPLANALQMNLYEDFAELLRLIGEHPDMVKSFENSPR